MQKITAPFDLNEVHFILNISGMEIHYEFVKDKCTPPLIDVLHTLLPNAMKSSTLMPLCQ